MFLSCTRAVPTDFEFCGSVFTPATVSAAFDQASCLVVSGHASTQTCAQGSSGRHFWWSLLALSLSRAITHVWHHPLGCLSRLFIVNLPTLSALFVCNSVLSVLALEVRTETDLHLLGLLILLRLILDHRNLSPHAPGDLGNLIDDLHLRNLHDFLQSGCSERLRLHFRIFSACVWLLGLFLLHNWDVNYFFQVNFLCASCVVGTCI